MTSFFDKEKWRAQIVDVDFGSTLDEYILVLLERAYAEGRADALEEASPFEPDCDRECTSIRHKHGLRFPVKHSPWCRHMKGTP